MLETATTQTELQAAYQRAHEERALVFRNIGLWMSTRLALLTPHLPTKRAGQSGQPLNCDCPA
ncbi:hypothetical protein ALP8811_00137 [Aliiroseovarius pelagivivens]|uniref:Uncharacterized protein n=1 Tax=Aliiroseovarius pelagivivens TaxID=1639690 RepID=A0A2R8AGG2_9RHOB|nr:hypothetical protein ALP8811_00137 [Aliiroseovarius pelagivivens]